MICRNCGAEIDDNAIFCSYCGSRTNGEQTNTGLGYDPYSTPTYFGPDTQESKSITILSFLFWQVGTILWFVWRRTRPGKARSALKGLIGSVSFQFPIVGLIVWLMWRKDGANREYAKIGGICAIVGASVSLILGALLILLAQTGNLDWLDTYRETIGQISSAFIQFKK